MNTLFDATTKGPLADRLRPTRLTEIVGQQHLLGTDKDGIQGPLARMLASGTLPSLILWGPPGTGKTTIARLLADEVHLAFEPLSAVFSGVQDLRKVFEHARMNREVGRQTLLFVDEIHRFNRAQQDGFLPYVENGTVVLVGATTENPSFELNAALLSRCQVLTLTRLEEDSLQTLLERAEAEEERPLPLQDDAKRHLCHMADGDGRYLLNMAEILFSLPAEQRLNPDALMQAVQKRMPLYDKGQENHYNLISALHKSLRGSDVDASLYWLERMLTGGEDGDYIARRLVRFAVEDIGLADPAALPQAIAAWQAWERLGSPEGELALVQSTIYLATAPKSNAAYRAEAMAKKAAKDTGSLPPPMHILNAPTSMMKEMGYGDGYAYDHDASDGFSGQNYFPDDMARAVFYQPKERGFEQKIKTRMEWWDTLRRKRKTAEH